jgi:hypothetical protein
MAKIEWLSGILDIQRIVINDPTTDSITSTLRGLAGDLGIDITTRKVEPQAGDLWIGSPPDVGWGESPNHVGWVRGVEVPLAIYQLSRAKPYSSRSRHEEEVDIPTRI